jgi:hypothetical protein
MTNDTVPGEIHLTLAIEHADIQGIRKIVEEAEADGHVSTGRVKTADVRSLLNYIDRLESNLTSIGRARHLRLAELKAALSEDVWDKLNNRRTDLILQKRQAGKVLSDGDAAELAALQRLTEARQELLAPLPIQRLSDQLIRMLEARNADLERRLEQSASAREGELREENQRLRAANRRLQATGEELQRDPLIQQLREKIEELSRTLAGAQAAGSIRQNERYRSTLAMIAVTCPGLHEWAEANYIARLAQDALDDDDQELAKETIAYYQHLQNNLQEMKQKLQDRDAWIWQYNENSSRIGKALDPIREKRHTGEPAHSDAYEVRQVVHKMQRQTGMIREYERLLDEARVKLEHLDAWFDAQVDTICDLDDKNLDLTRKLNDAEQARDRALYKMQRQDACISTLVGLAHREGWDGMANPKHLERFLEQHIDQLKQAAPVRELVVAVAEMFSVEGRYASIPHKEACKTALAKVQAWLPTTNNEVPKKESDKD